MPYKDPKKQAAYMRKYRRKKKAQAKLELLNVFTEAQIKTKIPTVHELIFGEKRKRSR